MRAWIRQCVRSYVRQRSVSLQVANFRSVSPSLLIFTHISLLLTLTYVYILSTLTSFRSTQVCVSILCNLVGQHAGTMFTFSPLTALPKSLWFADFDPCFISYSFLLDNGKMPLEMSTNFKQLTSATIIFQNIIY